MMKVKKIWWTCSVFHQCSVLSVLKRKTNIFPKRFLHFEFFDNRFENFKIIIKPRKGPSLFTSGNLPPRNSFLSSLIYVLRSFSSFFIFLDSSVSLLFSNLRLVLLVSLWFISYINSSSSQLQFVACFFTCN